MEHDPTPVPGETRDWTFVLREGCPECGWKQWPDVESLSAAWSGAVARWPGIVTAPGASTRANPKVWSPLEYGVHARDMIRLLGFRLEAMVSRHDPEFNNWDGDLANLVRRDWATDPRALSADLELAIRQTDSVLSALAPEQWERRGHRTDGAPFSVLTLWQYVDHDIEHHVWDVTGRRVES